MCGADAVILAFPQRSLTKFVSGETVSYKWDDSDSSVDTTKRLSIKQLPRHLLIHLKRFDFDYTTMTQRKLNDRFEFPRELDMQPFTLEGRPDPARSGSKTDESSPAVSHDSNYYKYELAGIVIHSGSAQAGHYYSYIRSRDREGHPWFEFNDAYVSPFDDNTIPDRAFGGSWGGQTQVR